MRFIKCIAMGITTVALFAAVGHAAHPGSGSSCGDCHKIGAAGDAPKVTPEEPGFMERMFQGKQSYRGHSSVSCAGSVGGDGKVSGCHAPENGYRKLLVMDLADKPVDLLCAVCHQNAAKFGLHHPSYKADKNGDGVGDYMIRPVAVQEVFTEFAPAGKAAPLNKYPDALVFKAQADGTKKLDVAIPLEKVAETTGDKTIVYTDAVSCTTCHNPHYGYLVELGKEEELKPGQVARAKGDALLRMRDYDNQLCVACH